MKRHGLYLQPEISPYDEILALQGKISSARHRRVIPDTVIFLEHQRCITVGRDGKFGNIISSCRDLQERDVKVFETDRGGDVTYHGPGQVVCYPIIDLEERECDIYVYARTLETMIIETLKAFGIRSGRKKGFPGIWIGAMEKIAFEGIAIDRGVTMHGVSLNVNTSLDDFSMIVPCGLSACEVTSMEKCLGRRIEIQKVMTEMRSQFSVLFDIELKEISVPELRGMIENE